MGSTGFMQTGRGRNAQEAFDLAYDQAQYEHGAGGYSGTLAEKRGFVVVTLPAGMSADTYVRGLMDRVCPPGVNAAAFQRDLLLYEDKGGPALCVQTAADTYAFFGTASI